MTELPKAGIVTLCPVSATSHKLLQIRREIQWKESPVLEQSCFHVEFPLIARTVKYRSGSSLQRKAESDLV